MKSILILLLFFLIGLNLNGQIFTGIPVSLRDNELAKSFTKVDIYRLNAEEISDYSQRKANGSSMTFVFGNERYEWKVYEHDLMRPESRVTTMKDGEKTGIDFDRSCRTFIGFRDDRAESARFTISGNYFAAMIPSKNTIVYIQPLHDFVIESDPDLFVLYTPGDLIMPKRAMCKDPLPRKIEKRKDKMDEYSGMQRSHSRTFNCRELQVTIANDSEMHEDFGAVVDEINFNLTVLLFMEPYYDDFDLDFWVEEIFCVTSNNTADNPWGTATEVDDLQSDFGDWAYDHFDSEDIGNLWTTHDLHDDDDYGTIGYASIGGACSDIGIYPWAVLENFNSNNFYLLSILQAHEYGHLLDADHEPGTGTIMEPSLGDIESPSWAEANIEEMLSFMEDESCIQSCVRCPIYYNIIDYIGWGDWKYSAQDHINSTARIDSVADVIYQAINYVKLTPGFDASAVQPSSGGGTFIARIEGCE